jgi:hypothetical protein
MRRYLSEFEVESEATLADTGQAIEIQPRSKSFSARLSVLKRSTESEKETLLVHLEHEAPDLDTAVAAGKQQIAQLLEILTFASGAGFGDPVLICVVDWTNEQGIRDLHRFTPLDQLLQPAPLLNQSLAESVSLLFQDDPSPSLQRALAWYGKGIATTSPDLKIQSFWLCFETLVEEVKGSEKVPDECQQCHSPLFCRQCNKISMHKPFEKQKIKKLFEIHHEQGAAIFEIASKARNILAHGGTLVGPRAPEKFPYVELVNAMGRAAWAAILHRLGKGLEGRGTFDLIIPAAFHRTHYRAVSHHKVEVPLEDGKLLPKNIQKPEVTLSRQGDQLVLNINMTGTAPDETIGAAYQADEAG